jgi:hypothetical protein
MAESEGYLRPGGPALLMGPNRYTDEQVDVLRDWAFEHDLEFHGCSNIRDGATIMVCDPKRELGMPRLVALSQQLVSLINSHRAFQAHRVRPN